MINNIFLFNSETDTDFIWGISKSYYKLSNPKMSEGYVEGTKGFICMMIIDPKGVILVHLPASLFVLFRKLSVFDVQNMSLWFNITPK